MCLTYCHRRNVLYWNHVDCTLEICDVVSDVGQCDDCRHKRATTCVLTNAPLPVDGGCCHCNVELVQGPQVITPAMLAPLSLGGAEAVEALAELIPVGDVDGEPVIDPDELGIPLVYGRGTEEIEEEEDYFSPGLVYEEVEFEDFEW